MLPSSVAKLAKSMVEVREGKVVSVVENKLESDKWNVVVEKAVWGSENEKAAAKWLIWEVGQYVGVRPASINDLIIAILDAQNSAVSLFSVVAFTSAPLVIKISTILL